MMQMTGKSASFRGLTLLLALMLGAGLALTGCGDDDSSPATPAPAPPAPPPAPEPPGTPANFRVASTGSDYIEFSWDAVEGATGYEVEMSMTEGDFSQAMKATVTGTMHKFTVAAETTGYGRVRAMNDDGASNWSDAVTGMSMAAPLVLGVPMPTVSSTGPDHIEWSWEPVANAAGYVFQVAATMDGLETADLGFTEEAMHRATAEPNMEMYIRVRATAGERESPVVSDWSAAVMGMSAVAPLTAPTVTVSSTGHDHIEFSWEAVAGATGYEIQLSMTEGDFSSVATATVEGTMHRFTVDPETTGYARVRAVEGERQSDWSETATGMSTAAPLMLAVPTPTVSSTGPDHIEWSWDAVENAEAYDVQVAATMAGLEDAEMEPITETKHRVTAEPETEMYIRVRAAAGTETSRTTSEWSDAASGVSDAAPMPLMVSMRPPEASADRACGGQAFCPDNQSDAKKAMASVNPRMLVNSSVSARVTPMFVDDASGVVVDAGDDQTPFTDRTWNAMQTMVAGDGVSFKFERVSTGAGQEPMPTGDVMYITCGPFRCSEAADEMPAAPEITLADSAVCDDFEVNLRLVKGGALNGYYYNDASGVDVGWVYTSTHAARVTHIFDNVTAGTASMIVPGTSLEPTSVERALIMHVTAAQEASSSKVNKFGAFANRDPQPVSRAPDALSQSQPGPIRNGPNDCMPIEETGLGNNLARGGWSYHSLLHTRGDPRSEVSPVRKPEQCFRLVTDGVYADQSTLHNQMLDLTFHNYLPGYSVRVDPVGGVSWAGTGVSDWGDDHPFDELKCESETFRAEDQLDICQDFQDEVDRYWGNGIGSGGPFRVEFTTTGTTNTDGQLTHIVIRNREAIPSPSSNNDNNKGGNEYRPVGSRHANMWLADGRPGTSTNRGLDGKRNNANMYWLDPYQDRHGRTGENWTPIMTIEMTDVDGDPGYGDFGKIDMAAPNGQPENMTGEQADHASCTNADGPGCDATETFNLSATFTRIANTDSCTRTIEQSITCTWDADGDNKRKGPTTFDNHLYRNTFISCQAAN